MKKLPQTPISIFLICMPLIRPVLTIAKQQLWTVDTILPIFLWLIGIMVGYFILKLDQLMDIYLVNPQSNLALTVKSYLKEGRYLYGLKLLELNKHLQPKLSFHSAPFQLVWLVLAIFTFSSAESVFGKGVVAGIGLKLLLEQWHFYQHNKRLLQHWLFWQLGREVSSEELKWYLWIMTVLTILLVVTVSI